MVISNPVRAPLCPFAHKPLILAGLYYIRKGVSKWIIISRIFIPEPFDNGPGIALFAWSEQCA